jgi:hypothetical protein
VEVTEDKHVSLVQGEVFGGNVWSTAWTIVSDTIYSFFEGIEFDINKIGEFFQAILDGIVDLAQWVIKKAFRHLTTDFDRVSYATGGYMDLPLLQADLGLVTNFIVGGDSLNNSIHTLLSEWQRDIIHNNGGTSNNIGTYSLGLAVNNDDLINNIEKLLQKTYSVEDENGNGVLTKFARMTEIVIPFYADINPDDVMFKEFIIRIGLNTDKHVVLSVYCHMDASDLGYEDSVISYQFHLAGYVLLQSLSNVVPFIRNSNSLVDTTYVNKIANGESNDDLSLYDRVKDRMFNVDLSSVSKIENCATEVKDIIIGLLIYSAIFGTNGILPYDTTVDVINQYCSNLRAPAMGATKLLPNYTLNYDVWNRNTFRPYSNENFNPVTIHYQTTYEKSSEIINCIISVVVAAAVVYTTVKLTKYVNKRKANQELLTVSKNQAAIEYYKNPNAENYKEYMKLYKKEKRTTKFNSLLGLNSSSASTNLSFDSINNQLELLKENEQELNLDPVISLIRE